MPPLRSLSRAESRRIDARAADEYGLPTIVLMENAGRGAAEVLLRMGAAGRVVICAGKGNNGGDGFVVARHLDLAGCDVQVLLCCRAEELTGDARTNYGVLHAAGLSGHSLELPRDEKQLDEALATADWVVDALLGTGTQGNVREPYATCIAAINRAGRKVLAIDLPSGMDCDTGVPLGACVRADATVTFVGPKRGFDAPGARAWTGEVHVVDIGVPGKMLRDLQAETERGRCQSA